MERIAVYPGSFDPVTPGHIDIMRRGAALFDRLIVAVATNPAKQPLFEQEERISMIRDATREMPNVEVDGFSGLIVDFARLRGARAILRGVRTFSDFEYELQMALTNRTVLPEVETVFVMTSVEWSFVSSRLIKEVASLGGDVSSMLTPEVLPRLEEAIRRRKAGERDGGDPGGGGWGEPEEGASARPEDEGIR